MEKMKQEQAVLVVGMDAIRKLPWNATRVGA